MSRKRTFDYDDAKRRHEAGETVTELARSLGVSYHAVKRAVDGNFRERADRRTLAWSREQRTPCAGGCGRLVWAHTGAGRTGRCVSCSGLERRTAEHGTESKYKQGCRCGRCRLASSSARATRRQRIAA